MNWKPYAPYFLIRIPKKEQLAREQKIGNIYLPPAHVFLTRGVQSGQIVAIGEDAAINFPEAKIGNILLCHHFIEGKIKEKADDGRYLIDEDSTFKYYIVTSQSFQGRNNETYGVFDGRKITAHREFVFLEPDVPLENNLDPNAFIDHSIKKTDGGILVFKQWKESREQKGARMAELKNQVKELTKSRMTDEVKKAAEELEAEMDAISKDVNKKRYEPYIVSVTNPILSEWFGREVKIGDEIYCLNMASHTEIEFMNKKYRVVKIDYVGGLVSQIKEWVESKSLKSA